MELGYVNCVLRLPPELLEQVAQMPDVVSIQAYSIPQKRDERQGQILAGNLTGNLPNGPGYMSWLTSKGFTASQFAASGFAVDVSDSGIDNGTQVPGHFGLYTMGNVALPSRVVYNRLIGIGNPGSTIVACDGHGNINAHIIGGYNDLAGFPHVDSAGYHYGLGICPFVRVGSSVIFDPNTFTSPNYAQLQSRAYQDNARISCNSWGASVGGAYNSDAQMYDALVRDAQPSGSPFPTAGNQQMVIVFSAGNSGSSANTIGAPGTAKNLITVGAAENVHSHSTANGGNNTAGNDGCNTPDTGADSANDIIAFSSRGPCDDGRIKPDIMGPGTHVTGGVGQQASPGANGTALTCFAGTGVCALPGGGSPGSPNNFFPAGQQFYTTSSGTSHSCPAVGGGAALLRQFFINQGWAVPSPAMTKAWLMNSSRYMTGLSANDTLPSNNQGMGSMNLGMAFDGVGRVRRDQSPEDKFTATGQTLTLEGTVQNSTKPFRVTLAWTDAPGSTAGNAYRNDLNLVVTVGGQTYRGNVFSGSQSITGGIADIRNNVESVFLPAGLSGTFTVTVSAANINSDGVPNDIDLLDQDYALVVYNATEGDVLLVPAGATLNAESCTPAQGAIDPGEAVTVGLTLQNLGPSNTTALVATLLPSGGVTAPSAPQNYGVVQGNGGPAVTRVYSFIAGGDCGQTLTCSLQLQDGTNDWGIVQFPFALGLPKTNALSGTNSSSITIAAASSTGTPYPSTINVTNLAGRISKIAVTVLGLSHSWPDDLDVLLVGPEGQQVLLLSDAGGPLDVANLNLTFDSSAAAQLPDEGPLTTGTWRPTNFETDGPLPAPAPAGTTGESLSAAFSGTLPNGNWALFVADDYGSEDGGMILQGWNLQLTTTNIDCCIDPTSADLATSLAAVPPTVALSNIVTYTLTVTNRGPATATSVTAPVTLSSNSVFLSVTVSQGFYSQIGNQFTFNLGTLAPGAAATAVIEVRALGGPQVSASANVNSSQPDPNLLNNPSTATSDVQVPQLIIQDTTVTEGSGGTNFAVFLVALSQPAVLTAEVDFFTESVTAVSGTDYVPRSGRVTFLPGQLSTTIEVAVLGDLQDETDESFRIRLTNSLNASIGDAEGLGTIIDDDPVPGLVISNAVVLEGNAGTTNAVVTISLSQPSGRQITVSCSTSNGTAQATDYQSVFGRIVQFAPGQTSSNVLIAVFGDLTVEPNETFLVQCFGATNAVIADGEATVTILSDDLAPLVKLSGSRLVAEQGGITNGLMDPGETVTVSLALVNEGSLPTANLVATLQASGGVSAPSGPQNYGVLPADGGTQVARAYTFTVANSNCSSLVMTLQLQDGPANLGTANLTTTIGGCWFDDFEPDIDASRWASFGGFIGSTVLATNYGGSVSGTRSLWFGDSGIRHATTVPIDTLQGGSVSFQFRLGNGSGTFWETVDVPGEGVVLEYSINGGSSWALMGQFDNANYYSWTLISSPIPPGAQTAGTQFRWRQLSHSGNCCDHWALDDVMVVTGPQSPSILQQPGDRTTLAGTDVAFNVVAGGSTPLSYQWRFHGTNLPGATSTNLVLSAVTLNHAGPYSVLVQNPYGSIVSDTALLSVVEMPGGESFRVESLLTNGSQIVDHNSQTGDDRGGIAISSSAVFYNGDTGAGRFGLNLTGGTALGQLFDAWVSDLRSGMVYSMASPTGLLTSSGGTATRLAQHDPATGLPNGTYITLSSSIPLTGVSGNVGFFAGYGRILVHNGSRMYVILLPSGIVVDLGLMTVPAHTPTETWAYWGIAEFFNGVHSIVYVQSSSTIARTEVPGGLTTTVGSFSYLSDMAAITVSVPLNRWYFHYEGSAQFGGSLETLGFAPAVFSFTCSNQPPTIVKQPAHRTAIIGGNASFDVNVGGCSPFTYAWRKDGAPIPNATNAVLNLLNVQSNHVGNYSVIVSNLYGSVLSSNALLSVVPAAQAIVVFDDPAFVDTVGGNASESDNIQASLTNSGFVVVTCGLSNLTSTLPATGTLLVPEQEVASLSPSLTATHRTGVSNLVFNGGMLVVHGAVSARAASLVNTLFGFSISETAIGATNFLNFDHAAGTAFADDSLVLPPNDACSMWLSGTLPPGSRLIYTNGTQCLVALIPVGSGKVIFLGWDWYNAFPQGTLNGGWLTVLQSAMLERIPAVCSNQPPTIVTQPAPRTSIIGGNVSFDVNVGGCWPFTYAWQKDGAPISNATNAVLNLLNVQSNHAGNYSVIVSNAYGSVLSSNALLTLVPAGQAIVVFDDPAFVDTIGGTGSESDNVQASLTNSGFVVVTCVLSNLTSILSSGGTLLVPEQELNALAPALTATHRAAVSNTVFNGGMLVVHGAIAGSAASLVNTLFGFSITETTSALTNYLNLANASGTAFADDPLALPPNNACSVWLPSSLPPGSRSIYTNGNACLVALIPLGAGKVIFLGWDWYDAFPPGTLNGGWLTVLQSAMLERIPAGPTPPTILIQPANQVVPQGGQADFCVGAIGTPPFDYQWRFHNTNLPGAFQPCLSIPGVSSNNVGPYSAVVSNAYGAVTSLVATLTISTQTVVGISLPGTLQEHEALAGTLTNLGFGVRLVTQGQWSGVNVVLSYPGCVSGFGPNLTDITNGVRYVKISDHGSTWTPNSFWTLTEGTNVTIRVDTAHPITIGLPTSWSSRGFWRYGYASSDYIGYSTDVSLPSLATETFVTSQSRVLAANTIGAGRAVYLGWNVYGPDAGPNDLAVLRNAILWAAGLADTPIPPSIQIQPVGSTVFPGVTATFGVNAWGTFPLTYQWSKNGLAIPNATTTSLTLSNVQMASEGNYSVLVSNAHGWVVSSNAFLRVVTNPLPVFSATFESGNNGFTFVGDPDSISNLWHRTAHRSSSPASSLYYGLENNWNYETGIRNAGTLQSPVIPLGSVKAPIRLSFNYSLQTEGGLWDQATVLISPNSGLSWLPVVGTTNSANPLLQTLSFSNRVADISAYAGSNIVVRFNFDTMDNRGNLYEGWYIDDVAVLTAPKPALRLEITGLQTNGSFRLQAGYYDGSPVTSADLSSIRIYGYPRLPWPGNWDSVLLGPLTLTNGVVVVDGLSVSNWSAQFFRAWQIQ